jgi:hypothetical protein
MSKKTNQPGDKTNYSDMIELENSKVHIIVEIIEYVTNAVVSKTILRKITGNVTAMSFAKGEELGEKIVPFDTFIQIIHGKAEVTIQGKRHQLK